jgi:hypothetical protein
MNYYSHVLHIPDTPLFRDLERRWPSFVGAFVAPLVRDRQHLIYWFSYYTSLARFRVWTDRYDELRPDLERLRNELGLVDQLEEKGLTLEGDLGVARFIGPNTTSNRTQRALKILHSLHSVCELVVDSVQQDGDGSWSFEANGDPQQNPIGNHFFSVTHLYHNLTGSPGLVIAFGQPPNDRLNILSYYYFWNEVGQGNLPPEPRQEFPVLL